MALTLEAIDAQLAKAKAEVADLEAARRVLLRIEADSPVNGHTNQVSKTVVARPTASDLLGKTILDCATAILGDYASALHYRDVADQAMQRGYSSGRETDDPIKSVRQSFWATLKRNPDRFVAVGMGRFRLVGDMVPAAPEKHRRLGK